ncbi:DUF4083 domain-containing protein [Neobacillus notoginsengisoli]|uniref:DUF4083 domain-containing protein n=1 Tax=Neobacillus notoginsengisoli TaxID=1578198 RepID=A0A417YVV1_9BACI|nr:DUF4083 family protein [Neobacillus notoginsengisoli]RHW41520.1 DUF4083 domain-containing protein [Neobacillus notoginsengisoli]
MNTGDVIFQLMTIFLIVLFFVSLGFFVKVVLTGQRQKANSIMRLEERLDRTEEKLDRIISLLEKQ